MTSFRQIEANRRNALKSTGPNTEEGKCQSRRNAIRHGLCAETVIEMVEDTEDYRGFEAAVIADYDAQTAVERELVLRLASLLWRLRRATSIETDLLRIQAEILRDRRDQDARKANRSGPCTFAFPHPKSIATMTATVITRSKQTSCAIALTEPTLSAHREICRSKTWRRKTWRHETWRIASSGSPISTMACSSDLDDMKLRYGAKWCRPSSCSKQPDVADRREAIRDRSYRPLRGLVAAALRNPTSTTNQLG